VDELYTPGSGVIHRMDARVKVVWVFAFILLLNLSRLNAWRVYLLFLALVTFLIRYEKVNGKTILRRTVIFTPFLLAVVPLIFFGPTPRGMIQIGPDWRIPYSPEGFTRVINIIIRSSISILAVLTLMTTTRFSDQLVAFRQLKLPKLLVAITGLMWRYLFIISDEATALLRARASRSGLPARGRRAVGAILWQAGVAGGMVGSLFVRSLERSERIYAAMLSRGYTGDLPVEGSVPLARSDRRLLITGFGLLLLLYTLGNQLWK